MAQMVKRASYDAPELDVLLNPDNAFEIGVQVNNTSVSVDANGRKIINAGTPVGATTSVLKIRNTVLSVTNTSTNGANSQGVLRHDVDVTDGVANATLIVRGEIDSSKCPTIATEAENALVHLIFVNGGAY
jgi:hypothetical protein